MQPSHEEYDMEPASSAVVFEDGFWVVEQDAGNGRWFLKKEEAELDAIGRARQNPNLVVLIMSARRVKPIHPSAFLDRTGKR